MGDIHDGVHSARLKRGLVDRYQNVELRGRVLTLTVGDVGTQGKTRTKTYPNHYAAARRLRDELIRTAEAGYVAISLRELNSLRRIRKPTEKLKPQAGAGRRDVAQQEPQRTPERAPSRRARGARGAGATVTVRPRRAGPYALALTSAVLHFPKFKRASARKGRAPRATSGGRPILADGQAWPSCSRCDERLCLYAQFDIDARFELAFVPGSHFLLFHCKSCDAIPDALPRGRLPAKWLVPDFRSTYRVILNQPDAREVIHEPDPVMLEQSVSFTRGKETLSENRDGVYGLDDVKLGGIPSWRQAPEYPICACGAPMGFVMQVPPNKLPGWKARRQIGLAFSADLFASIFFCSAQSSPYAGVIVAQR